MRAIMLGTTALLVVFAAPLSAQRMVHFSLGGGVAVPVGTVRDTYSSKESVVAMLTTGSQDSWLGTRLDYSYNEFTGRRVLSTQSHGTHMNIVTANLVASVPLGQSVKPYLLGGGGWYQHRDSSDVKWSGSFGINGGVGFTFPFLASAGFMEARYHYVYGNTIARQLVPITIGIVF